MPARSRRNAADRPNGGSPGRAPGRSEPPLLTPRLLRDWPLPQPAEGADKEGRGRVLVVAGASELMGAAMLAATATLRAGGGKLRIATVRSIAPFVALAVPEARVNALPDRAEGGLDPEAADMLAELANGCRATLIGPGLVDTEAVRALLARLKETALVLDAEAMMAVPTCLDELHTLRTNPVLTPHAGEMAGLLGEDKERVAADRPASNRPPCRRALSGGRRPQGRRDDNRRAERRRVVQPRRQRRPRDLGVRRHALRDHRRAGCPRRRAGPCNRLGRLPAWLGGRPPGEARRAARLPGP